MRDRPSTAIRTWPQGDRPREKLAERGCGALSATELLAILIRTGEGRQGRTAVDLARALWAAHGESWEALGQATPSELAAQPGVGLAKAASIAAALEIARRLAQRPLVADTPFRSSRQVHEHFSARLAGVRKERFFCLLLDARNRFIREEQVSEGSLTASLVHPREAFRPAVRESASAVIFSHNHPSGDPAPSQEDSDLTRRLCEAGKILGIRVLDHVIIGASGYFSYADAGELPIS